MTIIRPVSDLRNYSDVLKDVAAGSPVFLTKNGRGAYVIIDIEDYNNMQDILKMYDSAENRKTKLSENNKED